MIPSTIIGVQGKVIKVPSDFLKQSDSKNRSNLSNHNVEVRSYSPAISEATGSSVKSCYLVGNGISPSEGIFHILSENIQYAFDEGTFIYPEDIHQIYINSGYHSITLSYIRTAMSQAFKVFENGGITHLREMKESVGRLFASEKMRREKIRINGKHLTYGYRFITYKK